MPRIEPFQWNRRQLQGNVELTAVAEVHGVAAVGLAIGITASQEACHCRHRLLGCGKPNAGDVGRTQGLQPLHRQRQMGAPLAGHQGVDFVHDEGFNPGEQLAAAAAGEQQA